MLASRRAIHRNSVKSILRRAAARGASWCEVLEGRRLLSSTLPAGWLEADIGAPGQSGYTSYDDSTGAFTVAGGGSAIGAGGDQFRYVYLPLHGDGQITARIASLDNPADAGKIDPWSTAGLMLRRTTDADSSYFLNAATFGQGSLAQGRGTEDGTGDFSETSNYSIPGYGDGLPNISAPYWLRLTREGNALWPEFSLDGVQWQKRLQAKLYMSWPADVYVGLAVTAHDDTRLSEAKFDHVTVTTVEQPPMLTLRSVTTAGAVSFGWPNSPAFKSVTAQRSDDPAFPQSYTTILTVDPASTNRLYDSVMDVNQTYYYRAMATTDQGVNTAWSGTIAVTPATGTSRVIGQGASARQWNNTTWSGTPKTVALVKDVGFNWLDGSDYSLNNLTWNGQISSQTDTFTTIFSGQITPPESGTYTFLTRSDDSAWLWVNGQLVSSDPGGHGVRDPGSALIVPITLTAGQPVDFIFKHQDTAGAAAALMYWYRPSTPTVRETVPSSVLTSALSAPSAPTDFAALSNGVGGVVGFSFTDTSWNETNFEIQRSTEPTFNFFTTAVINGNQAPVVNGSITAGDTILVPGTTYYYRVRAINYDAQSAWSDPLRVDVPEAMSLIGRGVAGHYFGSSNGNEPLAAPGAFAYAQVDPKIDFSNGDTPAWDPFPSRDNTEFSVNWTGKILVDADGTYTFRTRSDDASYLWIDGSTAVQAPGGHGEAPGVVGPGTTLTAGWHNFVYSMGQGSAGYSAHMEWIVPGATEPVPVPQDHLSARSDRPQGPTLSYIGLTTTRVTINLRDNAINEAGFILEFSTRSDFSPEYTDTVILGPSAGVGNTVSYQYNKVSRATGMWVRAYAVNYDGATLSNVLSWNGWQWYVHLEGEALSGNRNYLEFTSSEYGDRIIKRAMDPAGPWTTIATVLNTRSYLDADSSLLPDTVYYYQYTVDDGLGVSSNVVAIKTAASSMIPPWQSADIGTHSPGFSDHSGLHNSFIVSGSGTGMGVDTDSLRYVWQALDSDVVVTSHIWSDSDAAAAGVMIRGSLAPDSAAVFLWKDAQGGLHLQSRTAQGLASTVTDVGQGYSWFRLVKTNSTVRAYVSTDEWSGWKPVGEPLTMTMWSTYLVGMAVASNDVAQVHTAQATLDVALPDDRIDFAFVPTNVSAIPGVEPGVVWLTWQDNSDAETAFLVMRSDTADGAGTLIANLPPNTISFIDHLAPGEEAYYRVVAQNSRGANCDSAPSDPPAFVKAASIPADVVSGGAGDDVFYIRRENDALVVRPDGGFTSQPKAAFAWYTTGSVDVDGLGGDDRFILDLTGGKLLPAGGMRIHGGDGHNTLELRGLPATAKLVIGGDRISIDGQETEYASAIVQLGGAASQATALGELTIAPGAQLDLGGHDLLVRGGSGVAKAITAWVSTALNSDGEFWTGPGLTSSTLQGEEIGLGALGVVANDDGSGGALLPVFDGMSVDGGWVLVKHTLFGDANLDGQITADDFAAAVTGWFDQQNGIAPTWMTGDYNYDSAVTGDDFALVTTSWFATRPPATLASATTTPQPIPAEPPTTPAEPFSIAGPQAVGICMRKPEPNPLLVDDLAVLA